MNEQAQNEINAVQILAKASEFYLTTIDELAKNFVSPQIYAAIQILTGVVNERNPQDGQAAPAMPAEDEAQDKKPSSINKKR